MGLLKLILNLSQYENPADRSRAHMIYWLVAVLVPVFALYAFVVPTSNEKTLAEIGFEDPVIGASIAGFFVVAALTLWANRSGRLELAAWGPALMIAVGIYPRVILTGNVNATTGMLPLVGLIMLALLKDRRAVIYGALGTLAVIALGILWRGSVSDVHMLPYITSMDDVRASDASDFFAMAAQIIGVSVLLYRYAAYAQAGQQQAATSALEQRNLTAEIVTKIAQRVSRREPIQNVFDEIIEQVNSNFDTIYHTQVFLIDDKGQLARLVASTGPVGEMMIQRKHALAVGSQSVIGYVTGTGQSAIASAGLTGTVHRRNELLPETRAEAAFPMRVGDRVIGALDIQSRNADAFDDPNFMQLFQALADSVALAVDNVSQYESAEARLKENTKLIDQMQHTLREVEHLNERLTGQVWSAYLSQSGRDLGLAVEFGETLVQQPANWTPGLEQALQTNQTVQFIEGDQRMIAVPLRVRGQVVGAMEFELGADEFVSEDLELLQEVSDHFGMAVENARLVDESQRTAWRETLLNQISSRLQSADRVEHILSAAAEGLQTALDAGRVSIRLGTPPAAANGGD
ncbi:MAG: GAF domain-containing protein [Phototrophicaceae bacterium]